MNVAVIFAGGIGKRMNTKALPKQFLKLHGKEIIIYTLEVFENHPDIDGIVISCVEEWIPFLKKLIGKYGLKKVKKIVKGGDTGQQSIYNGLIAAKECYGGGSIVLIHDGVRPLIEEVTITDNIRCVIEKGSAITVAPAIETVIRINEKDEIKEVIERSECLMARAPQSFYLKDILREHERAQLDNRFDFIDSAALMRHYGYSLATVPGPVENIKITTPMDYYTFRALYEAKESSQLFGI